MRIPLFHRSATSGASAASRVSEPPPREKLLAEPRLPRQQVMEVLSARRATNPITALVQKVQESPSATAVLIGAMGAVTLVSMAPREAVALEVQAHKSPEKLAEGPSSARERELMEKVGRLVQRSFGGDYRAAFDHYDASNDGAIGRKELLRLLEDADIGGRMTRGLWADGILTKIDAEHGNGDGRIQWPEFQRVVANAST